MTEREFVRRVTAAGGNVYVVGGFVRDMIRGVTPKDKDYCVAQLTEDDFRMLFADDAKRVGKCFPVYLVDIDERACEVAFARTEKKCGTGYRGFKALCDPTVTIRDDLWRRDTTMNAMALDLTTGQIIDLFGGRKDIAAKKIRAVGAHFVDDPVRSLRAARQAAEFDFVIDDGTYGYMAQCAAEIAGEPTERFCAEMMRALKTARPSLFFCALRRGKILRETFPEIFALIGKTQPVVYHPEGDAFNHTMIVLDQVAAATADLPTRFAALAHDLGKGVTPRSMLPHHYGHETRGLQVLAAWNERMTLPKIFLQAARLVIAEHMRAPRLQKPGKKVELLTRVCGSSLGLAGFNACIAADNGAVPDYLAEGEKIMAALSAVKGSDAPPEFKGDAIGQWITTQRVRIFTKLTEEF